MGHERAMSHQSFSTPRRLRRRIWSGERGKGAPGGREGSALRAHEWLPAISASSRPFFGLAKLATLVEAFPFGRHPSRHRNRTLSATFLRRSSTRDPSEDSCECACGCLCHNENRRAFAGSNHHSILLSFVIEGVGLKSELPFLVPSRT